MHDGEQFRLARLAGEGREQLAFAGAAGGETVDGEKFVADLDTFDRRALRQADEDQRARLSRKLDEEEQVAAISRAADVQLAGPPRLVLVAVLTP